MGTRTTGRLTVPAVAKAGPGLHHDGGGLYLQVGSNSKSWLFRFKRHGRLRAMGLGSASDIGLGMARDRASAARLLLTQGIDPIDHRDAAKAAAKAETIKAITFAEFATTFMDGRDAGLKNAKHRQQWRNTLSTYAYPIIGKVPVGEIDTPMVLRILQPIWSTKPESASRIRGRIEAILDAAKVSQLRAGDNPARWRGHLAHVLPALSKVRAVKHHAALDWRELPAFVANLRERDGVAARALLFGILNASRSAEVRLARWREIDVANKAWTIPADRMKAMHMHRVPLSAPAIALLEALPRRGDDIFGDDLIFPGAAKGKPMSDMTLTAVLRRMDRGVTAHGFRGSFKTWCRECTSFADVLSEAALAHTVGDKTMRAHARGDMFDQRRALMHAWSAFVMSADRADNVIALRPPGA
jgi:integrase